MTETEILTALGDAKAETEKAQRLTYLDADDVPFAFEGLSCEITFGLSSDGLALILLDFGDDTGAPEVREALTKRYGEGTEVQDLAVLAGLEAMSDPDEIDLRDEEPQTYLVWSAEDGTSVLMITDVRGSEAKVIF